MALRETIEEVVEQLLRIENEKKLLQEEQKNLLAEYKDKLDVKALKAALQIAKIKSRLGDSEPEMSNMLDTVEKKLTL
tara:strand:+ start:8102 stop:8335 length:234 start_codon:yes stop_codon:yes gene_type:complete